jgi:hypothetical protein
MSFSDAGIGPLVAGIIVSGAMFMHGNGKL